MNLDYTEYFTRLGSGNALEAMPKLENSFTIGDKSKVNMLSRLENSEQAMLRF